MTDNVLPALLAQIASGRVRIIDLTQTLSPEFPTLELPPAFGQCAPLRVETVSEYDERGPAWYWRMWSSGSDEMTSDVPMTGRPRGWSGNTASLMRSCT